MISNNMILMLWWTLVSRGKNLIAAMIDKSQSTHCIAACCLWGCVVADHADPCPPQQHQVHLILWLIDVYIPINFILTFFFFFTVLQVFDHQAKCWNVNLMMALHEKLQDHQIHYGLFRRGHECLDQMSLHSNQ